MNQLKYGIIFSILLFSACENQSSSPDISSPMDVTSILEDRAAYELEATPYTDEILEAKIGFMAPAVFGQASINYQYEIQITNNYKRPMTLERIDIVDLRNPEKSLETYTKSKLSENFMRPGLRPQYGNLELTGNGSGVAHLSLALLKDSKVREIFHRLTFVNDAADNENKIVFELARKTLPAPTSIKIGSPVESGDWAYFTLGHRNTRQLFEGAPIYPQRFALDMAKVGPDGNFARDASLSNESFYTYGQNLLAVKDGRVIATLDGLAENNPATGEMGYKMTRDTGGGNYVLLDIGDGLNVFYAHLIPGSIKVKPGDIVKQGDVLGQLGNSGNSDAPHLHLHIEQHSPANKPTTGEGIPFIFENAVEIDRFSPEKLEHLFETNTLLEGEFDLTLKPDNIFSQNGLLRFE